MQSKRVSRPRLAQLSSQSWHPTEHRAQRGGEGQGYHIFPLSLHLPAFLPAQGKVCIAAGPGKAALCPAAHAAHDPALLAQGCQQWHCCVSLQPRDRQKAHPTDREPSSTALSSLGQQVSSIALALGVPMRSPARPFLQGVSCRAGAHRYQDRNEGTGAGVFMVLCNLTEHRRSSWCKNCARSSAVLPSIPCSCRYCIPLFGFLLNLFRQKQEKIDTRLKISQPIKFEFYRVLINQRFCVPQINFSLDVHTLVELSQQKGKLWKPLPLHPGYYAIPFNYNIVFWQQRVRVFSININL